MAFTPAHGPPEQSGAARMAREQPWELLRTEDTQWSKAGTRRGPQTRGQNRGRRIVTHFDSPRRSNEM